MRNYDLRSASTAQLSAAIQQFHDHHGRWPSTRDRALLWRSCRAKSIDGWLRRRGSSLSKVIAQLGGTVRHGGQSKLPALTLQWIREAAEHHLQATGSLPHPESGNVLLRPCDNWRSIATSLRLGYRGLPGGASLASLLKEWGLIEPTTTSTYRPPQSRRSQRRSTKIITEGELLEACRSFLAANGKLPSQYTRGANPGFKPLTWRVVHSRLIGGSCGLPKSS